MTANTLDPETEQAQQQMCAYLKSVDLDRHIVTRLEGGRDRETGEIVWTCFSYTAETYDGENLIQTTEAETRAPTAMGAVIKCIAGLIKIYGGPWCIICGETCDGSIIDDYGAVYCSHKCMAEHHAHLDLIVRVAGQYEPGRLDHLRWESPIEEQ